jgi:hypothetical protein
LLTGPPEAESETLKTEGDPMKHKKQVDCWARGAYDFESTQARIRLWLISVAIARMTKSRPLPTSPLVHF